MYHLFFVFLFFGSADGANKKSHGYGLSSQNSVTQGSNVDHRESRLWNDCEGFDSRIEDSKDDVPVMSEPKKQKLHWGYIYIYNSTLVDRS